MTDQRGSFIPLPQASSSGGGRWGPREGSRLRGAVIYTKKDGVHVSVDAPWRGDVRLSVRPLTPVKTVVGCSGAGGEP